jgi:hypothetical protein
MQRISKDQQTDAPRPPAYTAKPAKASKRASERLSGPRPYVGSLRPAQRLYGPHTQPTPSAPAGLIGTRACTPTHSARVRAREGAWGAYAHTIIGGAPSQ